MKICPKCHAKYIDRMNFCTECGTALRPMDITPPKPAPSRSEVRTCRNCHQSYYGAYRCPNCGCSEIVEAAKPEPIVEISTAPAFSQPKPNVADVVATIQSAPRKESEPVAPKETIVEHPKQTVAETKNPVSAVDMLRTEANEIAEKYGRIDSQKVQELRGLAKEMGIGDDDFKAIIKEARSQGRESGSEKVIGQFYNAMHNNDLQGFVDLAPKMEVFGADAQDERSQFAFCLTVSLSNSEKVDKSTYWGRFWSTVMAIQESEDNEAVSKLVEDFNPEAFNKSEEDANILRAYYALKQSDSKGAMDILDEILDEPSEQLKPMHRAIECKIFGEEPDSPEIAFYTYLLFTAAESDNAAANMTVPQVTPMPQPQYAAAPAPLENKAVGQKLYEQAQNAKGEERLKLLEQAAEAGNADAQCALAVHFRNKPDASRRDKIKAFDLFKAAAEQGHIEALESLANCFSRGLGTEENHLMAAECLEDVLESRVSPEKEKALYYQLGLEYASANEKEESFRCMRHAAERGHIEAMTQLGIKYEMGSGTRENLDESIKWYKKAIQLGSKDAEYFYNHSEKLWKHQNPKLHTFLSVTTNLLDRLNH